MGTFPSGRNAYYDPMLSQFSSAAFSRTGGNMVADQIAPAVPAPKQSALYRVFDPEAWLKTPNDLRAPKTVPDRVTFTTSSATFFCHNRALSAEIALEDLANSDQAMMLRENHSELVVTQLKRAQEVRVARLCTASGNAATIVQATGAGLWTAVDSADILGQTNSAHIGIWNLTGMRPNTVVLDWESALLAQRNRFLLDLFRYTQGGQIPLERLRTDVFKVERLIIADAIQNTAGEGATMANSSIWGACCLFCYSNPGAASDMSPNFLTRFRWNPEGMPYRAGNGDVLALATFRSVYDKAGEAKVEVIESGYYQDERVTGSPMAYLLKPR